MRIKKETWIIGLVLVAALVIATPLVHGVVLTNKTTIISYAINTTLNISRFTINYTSLNTTDGIHFTNLSFTDPGSCLFMSSFYPVYNITTANNFTELRGFSCSQILAATSPTTFYMFVLDKNQETTGWNAFNPGITLDVSSGGVRMRSTGGGNNFAVKQDNQFFFNAPMNKTTLGYLGATMVVINWSARGEEAPTVGEQQAVFMYSSTDETENTRINMDGGGDLESNCGGTGTVQINPWVQNVFYNFTLVMNYTAGTSNISSFNGADGTGYVNKGCANTLAWNTEITLNKTLNVVRTAGTPGVTTRDIIWWANFDADYFNSGNPYSNFVNDTYFADPDEVNINVSVPFVVNISYKLNNQAYTTFCTNCQNFSSNITAPDGQNNITLNLTWQKNDITFSTSEGYRFFAGNAFAFCDDAVSGMNSPFFNVTFKDEEAISNNVPANFSIVIFTNSLLDPLFTGSKNNVVSSQVCGPSGTSFLGGYSLNYEGVNGTYGERTITTAGNSINFNTTNKYTTIAYLLRIASATTITFTIQDNAENPVSGAVVESYRFDPANSTYIFLESEITDFNGIALFDMVLNEQYRLLIKTTTGEILKDTGPFKVSETAYTIIVNTFQEHTIPVQQEINGITSFLTCYPGCNLSAQYVNATWFTTAGIINYACLEIKNMTNANVVGNTINVTCVSNETGTIIFPVNNLSGQILQARLYVSSATNGLPYTLKQLTVNLQQLFQRWGVNGLFIAIFIFFTIIVALVLNSPHLTILGVMIGTFVIYLTGITGLSLPGTMSIIFIGALLLYILKDRGGSE